MSKRPATSFVLICVFLDALGIGLIVPVLPKLIGTMVSGPQEQTIWYGAIMVSYGLMQFISSPIIGSLSDRLGRRPILLSGILGLGIMMLVPAFASHPLWILLSRIVGGAMSSNIVVAQAYISDVTDDKDRATAFGKIGAIFGIAFVVGPALGGILGNSNPHVPFMAASIICLVNFLYGLFVLPESLDKENRSVRATRTLNPFENLLSMTSNRQIRRIFFVVGLYTLSQSILQCTWALYTQYRYDWLPLNIGMSIFALGLSIAATQGLLLPFLIKRMPSPNSIITLALSIGFASLVGMGLSQSGLAAAVLFCTYAVVGVVGPTLQSIISRMSDPAEQGFALGTISSINSFTSAVSPIIGTPLLILTVEKNSGSLSAGIPYFLSSLLLVAAFAASRGIGTKK